VVAVEMLVRALLLLEEGEEEEEDAAVVVVVVRLTTVAVAVVSSGVALGGVASVVVAAAAVVAGKPGVVVIVLEVVSGGGALVVVFVVFVVFVVVVAGTTVSVDPFGQHWIFMAPGQKPAVNVEIPGLFASSHSVLSILWHVPPRCASHSCSQLSVYVQALHCSPRMLSKLGSPEQPHPP